MTGKEEVTAWLRDAYAMERGLEVSLKKQADNDALDDDLRNAIASHLEETRVHARRIESLLKSLGSDTSAIKTGVGLASETLKGLGTALAEDEPIKDLLATYAMEHFEIGCYKPIAAAAETADLHNVVSVCEEIIPEEEDMADAILDSLPRAVTEYLADLETT
jgi:ferritin-like metal-binding protein YciE